MIKYKITFFTIVFFIFSSCLYAGGIGFCLEDYYSGGRNNRDQEAKKKEKRKKKKEEKQKEIRKKVRKEKMLMFRKGQYDPNSPIHRLPLEMINIIHNFLKEMEEPKA